MYYLIAHQQGVRQNMCNDHASPDELFHKVFRSRNHRRILPCSLTTCCIFFSYRRSQDVKDWIARTKSHFVTIAKPTRKPPLDREYIAGCVCVRVCVIRRPAFLTVTTQMIVYVLLVWSFLRSFYLNRESFCPSSIIHINLK